MMRRWFALLAVVGLAAGCGPKPVYRTGPAEGEPAPARRTAAGGGVPGRAVEELARPWLGTPYRYGGTDRRGIDCSSLACNILGDLGVDLPRMVRDQRGRGRAVAPERLAPGDLLFFRLGSTRVNHVGVALDGNRFVHASSSRGVVIDDLGDDYFARNFVEARRVLGSGERVGPRPR